MHLGEERGGALKGIDLKKDIQNMNILFYLFVILQQFFLA